MAKGNFTAFTLEIAAIGRGKWIQSHKEEISTQLEKTIKEIESKIPNQPAGGGWGGGGCE